MDFSTETVDFAALRLRTGVNHFKKCLLGDRHVPGQAQTQLVMDELSQSSSSAMLASRTWASWFEQAPPRARRGTIATLDQCASSFSRSPAGGQDFYQELILGGLVQRLLAPTESKSPEFVLWQRAAEYIPQTSLHLHMDAIEVSGLSVGNGAVNWDVVKMIATSRITEILHLLWNHRSGRMYSVLSHDASEAGELAAGHFSAHAETPSHTELDQIFHAWAVMPRKPKKEAIAGQRGLSAAQVHRTLLALAADVELLQGRTFEAWWLDLASAALALHSSTWVHRYEVFTDPEEPEVVYLDALQSVYFRNASPEETVRFLVEIHALGAFPWTSESYGKILLAQCAYRTALSELALSPALVEAAYLSCEARHPLVLAADGGRGS